MSVFGSLVKSVIVIVVLYILAVLMKKKGDLTEKHSLTLAKIVTDLCLPAIIFVSLAGRTIKTDQLSPAFMMLCLEIGFVIIAWLISKAIGMNKNQQGAVVFCSAFGSSTFLGYALIAQMFPTQPQAMTEAVLISEIGVGYPIFILGPILASYFGSESTDYKGSVKAAIAFFKSPVFYALILGLLWSHLGLPGKDDPYFSTLFQIGDVLAAALTPLAILSVGLMFKIPKLKSIIIPLIIVVGLKLILKPLAAAGISDLIGYPELWKDVLVLLAAMPPAVLGAVFLRRYGGDAKLASALLLTATILSCLTLLAVFAAI